MLSKLILSCVRYYTSRSSKTTVFREGLNNAFGKHLLFTNTWTSGVLMFAGDLMQQELEYRKGLTEHYDWSRLGRMFLTGLLFGPLHHYFYGWMERILPGRDVKSVTKKILLDQVIMSPACIACFVYAMGALEMKSTKACTIEFKEKFGELYFVDWLIWPPTQFINFHFLPGKYQVLYVNAVTMGYNVFLSHVKHRDSQEMLHQ